ncbi:hypothetical protein A3K86_15125 [Photobacterium jeanii]|uniref:Uncharacterized protein n=1 Tax=Photobacterium jeanii TaxID=858640 RepID=A0A178K6P9_9GAMM|nr:hypothetical protein [Photobacterium jeanii]OAN13000.1 hypothetical protein A3K86_15125 [Photobacterium jeanii]PST89148.1 hypothetical protein C9I91_13570 [Photobacterium jeanii]
MNQFDKNKIIPLDVQDPQQIKTALIQYQTLLNTDQAFHNQEFDVEFIHSSNDEQRRLQPSDAGSNLTLLQSALNMGQEGGSHYYDHEITDDCETYISEVILFAAALQYPELKDTVVDTAKAIVAITRRMNDTSDMWIDDMRVFGIEALYMLTCTDLQYAYLIGQYFIPYWDDEHATQYEDYLASLLQKHGWHPEIIKAFIWCDNPSFRKGMFMNDPYSNTVSYQPLGDYLQENPDQYASFKQMVIARFQAEPVLLCRIDTTEEEEEDYSQHSPVVWLYQSLFPHTSFYDEEEALDAFMQQPFMASTLENEAYDLEATIRDQVSNILVKPSEGALKERAEYLAYLARGERQCELNYGTEVLKPLILAMPQGEDLWLYIENGEDRSALDALEEIELIPLAKAHAPEMSAQIEDHLCSFEYNNQGITEELSSILELVRGDLLTNHFGDESTIEHENGLITTLTVTPDSKKALLEARRQQYLRVIDVFYHALGKRELREYMMESLTEDDEPLISRQDYFRRYSQLSNAEIDSDNDSEADSEALEPALSRDVESIFAQFTDEDEILYSKDLKHVDEVLRTSRELCHPQHWPEPDMGFMALASYQLYRDFNEQIGDDVTHALFNYLNEHNVWEMAASKIIKEAYSHGAYYCPDDRGLKEDDIARIKAYFSAEKPEDDQASLLALLEPQLFRDDCCRRSNIYINKYSEYQPGYKLFNDHDEDFQRFTLIAFWLRQLPLPIRVQADRLWQFIITLAPVRAARNVLRAYSDDSYDIEFANVLDSINIHEQLEKAGISQGILSAYEMSRQFYDETRYSQWLSIYSEITSTSTSMFGSIDRKKAEAMADGLKYINEHDKIEFLHHASLKYPEIPLDLKHDLKRALNIMVQLNIHSWEQALAHEYGKACLFNGDGDKTPAKLRLPILSDENTVHDKPCHMDGMSWMSLTVVQKRASSEHGDHHAIIMADHEVPLELYQEALPRGPLLIFAEDVDSQAIVSRIAELQNLEARIEHIVAQTLSYLDGDVDFDAIASLYAEHLSGEYFSPNAEEYTMYGLDQFIWTMEPERRDRFTKLLFNHNYRGFKIIERNYEKPWLHHQLTQGEINFETYLERVREYENEATETGMRFLLNWLMELEVNPAHITLFCIKYSQFDACCEFIHEHARERLSSFKKALAYLHAGRRAELPEILSKASDAENLIALLAKDRSRVVKEAVAKYLPSVAE